MEKTRRKPLKFPDRSFITRSQISELRHHEDIMRSRMNRDGVQGHITHTRWGCGCIACWVGFRRKV